MVRRSLAVTSTRHITEIHYQPSRKIVGFEVTSKLTNIREFSPTAEIIRVFNEENVPLITLTKRLWDWKTRLCTDFVAVDLTDTSLTPEFFLKKIKKRFGSYLVSVKIIKDLYPPGFLHDSEGFPYAIVISGPVSKEEWHELPALIFPTRCWRSILADICKEMGTGGLYIIWRMSRNCGKRITQEIKRLLKIENQDYLLAVVLGTAQNLGVVRALEYRVDWNAPSCSMKVECATRGEDFDDTIAMYTKGFLEGIISEIAGRDVVFDIVSKDEKNSQMQLVSQR